MPIVWGANVTKVFAATWLAVLFASIIVLQVYILQHGFWLGVVYSFIFIIIPIIRIGRNLYYAKTTLDYHRLSTLIKIVMLTGILSMIFFKLNPSWIL